MHTCIHTHTHTGFGVSVKITEAMEVVIERRCYFKVVWEESIRREYLSRDLKEVKE